MNQDITIRVTLYKSKTLANGEHPLMLVVTKDGVRKYTSLGISCHADRWNSQKDEPKKSHPEKLKIEAIIAKRTAELQSAVLDLKLADKAYSPASLVSMVQKPKGKGDVLAYLGELIERFTQHKKIGNADVYADTLRVLKRFVPKNQPLHFSDIDLNFLNRLETHLRSGDMKETSMSLYFRTLRATFNKAISEKMVSANHYPFKDFKISKFDTRTRKRAISKADVRLFEAVDVSSNPKEQLAKDVFLFSYYGQGINMKDIAFLRWSNITQDRLLYTRAKTGKMFNLKLALPSLQILERYRIFSGDNSNNYVFPILDTTKHLTPQQIENRVQKLTGQINKHLKAIGRSAGIDVPLTTYVARHTYVTVLKTSGVSVAVISEAMGHQTEAITQTYLKSFENEVIDMANENLL